MGKGREKKEEEENDDDVDDDDDDGEEGGKYQKIACSREFRPKSNVMPEGRRGCANKKSKGGKGGCKQPDSAEFSSDSATIRQSNSLKPALDLEKSCFWRVN